MNWFERLTKTGRMEKELDAELRFHFESQVADKVRGGLTEAEARRATRLEFGALDQIKEDCRESRGTLWLVSILQDLRFGARILARSPGFSVTAIVVLALGIGVSTLAFSLYSIISLQSIPVRDPATLVRIQRRSPENITPGVPYASIAWYRDNAKSLSAVMATMQAPPMVLNQELQRVHPEFVTSNYFMNLAHRPSPDVCSIPLAITPVRLRLRSSAFVIGKESSTAIHPSSVSRFVSAENRPPSSASLHRDLPTSVPTIPTSGFLFCSILTLSMAASLSPIQRSMA